MIIPLLTAITPFIPLIQKAIKVKEGSEKIKESTGMTEVGQIGYVSAIYLVIQDATGCGAETLLSSLNCVTAEHWGALVVSLLYAITRSLSK